MTKGHVLITGGAGFIGSHLTDYLLGRGFKVSVLDSLIEQVHGDGEKDSNGWPCYLNPMARRIRGDAGNPEIFEHALKGITHLVHLAASVGVGQSMCNIAAYTQNNTGVAASMLDVLSKGNHTIKRIAVASSMSVYGEFLGRYHHQPRRAIYSQAAPTRRAAFRVVIGGLIAMNIAFAIDKTLDVMGI